MTILRRTLFLPLVPIYAGAVKLKKRLLDAGRLTRRSLRDPVVSIGSLSAGGAGKTPIVLLIARLLKRRGYSVRILTRGYRRASDAVERVDPAGDPARFGDEPMLLAQRSGAPVYVGTDRYQAGLTAQEGSPANDVVYLLDDGFQHRRLERDMDIVLLTQQDVDDVLLPAGNLREPLSTLQYADVVVLREEEAPALMDLVERLTCRRGLPPIWLIRRRLEFATASATRQPRRPLAFCGIARPESFWIMLQAEGAPLAGKLAFPDHHRYGNNDISRLLDRARQSHADGFLTTEKDAVKLTDVMRSRLECVGPLVVPQLHVELVDEARAVEQMFEVLRRFDQRRSR